MGRLIVANRRGHQVLEWPDTDTEEARQQIALVAPDYPGGPCPWRAGLQASDGQHVLDRGPYDPQVEEYQIVAPIAGG